MSLEDQMRAALDATRGLTDVSLKIQTGQYAADQMDPTLLGDAVVGLWEITKTLMDCTVDLARAIDQLAEHTDYQTG